MSRGPSTLSRLAQQPGEGRTHHHGHDRPAHASSCQAPDEAYGFLPPHPANPQTKRPIVVLMKQARAFGVGVVIATQNPMDLDYRALSNAGILCLGRLQTDADRERVIDGLALTDDEAPVDLNNTLQRWSPRWFVVRDAHASSVPVLQHQRHRTRATTCARLPRSSKRIWGWPDDFLATGPDRWPSR